MWSDESIFTLFQSDGRKIKLADYLNVLSDWAFPSMDFLLP